MIARSMAVILWVTGGAYGAELARDDFAYAVDVTLDAPASVYRVPLTSVIYQDVTRADLGDVRVYNGAQEVVPHAITRPELQSAKTLVDLPLFVVSAPASAATDDISLQVTRGKSGSIVNVRSQPARAGGHIFYLIDAGATKDPLGAIEVDWDKNSASDFIGTLQAERSEDLKTWQSMGRGAIAALAREGHALAQRRIEFTPRRAKYIRLSWLEPTSTVRLTQARGELRTRAEPQRDWFSASIADTKPESGEYRFDAKGWMPIDRARVVLPANGVARVAILSRDKDGDPWRLRGQKVVFNVTEGARAIHEDEIDVGRAGARQWLLRLDRHGGGLGADSPRLELGWVPDELIFVARGNAPFTLAYGNARAQPVEFGVDTLVRSVTLGDQQKVSTAPARLGARTTLRGEGALTLSWYRGDWKQWVLWAVLLFGVAVLGYVALRLVRALNRGNPPGG